ncbi:HD domain-containing protein [Sulfurimonas sp. SAG-AH-194-I05]|nr:HD domain-containing protein [Sulfurimonas sp. SAG-AH-194-I05]
MLVVIITIGLGYRAFFQSVMEKEAFTVSSAIKAGLTSHMKAGIMDRRDYFLDEIKELEDIKNIQIIHTNNRDFKPAKNILEVLKTKKEFFEWDDINGELKATMPYIANSKGTLNCLSCHDAQDGDVIGVIEMTIDINASQELVMSYGYIFIAILCLLSFIILANLSGLINRYISKPLSKVIDHGQKAYGSYGDINNVEYESKELEIISNNISSFSKDILLKNKEISQHNLTLQDLNEEIENTLKDTMMAMGEIEEIRSEETRHHTERVSKLSALFAAAYGLSEDDIKLIALASPMHDIGKIAIGDDILKKPGKLTTDEYNIMKTHAKLGYNVLKHSKRKALRAAAEIAYTHHEKWDGTGYPRKLKGFDIPIFGRIVAIVDVLDALLCKRVYKEAWSHDRVKALLKEERGKHFEEKLVDIALEQFDTYAGLVKKLS